MRVQTQAVLGLAAGLLVGAQIGLGASEQRFPLRLHTEGRDLRDASGKAVVLRGVNKPGFVDVPDGWWNLPGSSLYSGLGAWDPAAVKANLDEIQRWGCNVVRFHTCAQWWKDNPETFQDQWRSVAYPKPFRELFKDVVRWAGERGLYVIVDFYNMEQGSGQETLPWPPYSQHAGVIGSREEFLRLWEDVARELSPFPHVLFELYNEPHGDQAAQAEWFAFTQEAIGAIRAITDNVIVVQWGYGCWVNLDYPPPANAAATLDWIEKYPLKGRNILYSTHLYRDSGGGGSFAMRGEGGKVKCWERADLLRALRLAGVERVIRDVGKPLLVGEVGAHTGRTGPELEHEVAWLRNVLQILDEWDLGYAAWCWDSEEHLAHGMLKGDSFSAGPNAAGQVLMEALSRS